ncbi:MAG: FAD-dependent oxidoreductase [Chloroflexi bacterium]|nr:FAD-dependent oxidoreductase [Chloroflexota bacterium]
MVDFTLLFSPVQIKGLRLRNRIVYPAVVTRLAADHAVTPAILGFYAARSGGAGLIIVEPGMVDVRSCGPLLLGTYDDRLVAGLRQLVETVHAAGARVGIQLNHVGRQGDRRECSLPVIAPSPLPWSPEQETPVELSRQEIKAMVDKFAGAAARAAMAGFDMVEIHGANGYLISEFLSPHSNKRNDDYGGGISGRAKFAVEVVRQTREAVGPDFLISFRINGSDNVPGGLNIDDVRLIAPMLIAAGVDVISVSAGVFGSYPTIVPPFDMPSGCNVPLAAGLKSAVSAPLIVAGRLADLRLAEETLQTGKADLIAIGRPLVADPEFVEKAQRGQFTRIRPCICCNRCVDNIMPTETRICTVNPSVGKEKESEIRQAPQSKKVLIAGGGLAGLEAARVAAKRGHRVTVYEKEEQAGGQWILASVPPHKAHFIEFAEWLVHEAADAGVKFELGKPATGETVEKEKPDVVIVATGASPSVPALPGVALPCVATAWAVLAGKARVGQRALIVGGNALGLETADFLASQGKSIIVVEQQGRIAVDMISTVRSHLLHRLTELGVKIHRRVQVSEVIPHGVVVTANGKRESWDDFDNVVLAVGAAPERKLAADIEGKVKELYIIGDAQKPRNAEYAIREGSQIAMGI